ncbi:phage head-tail adapter protein [Staphylococcus pasteuri]|uniref:phage head-tail adapter protein n=1 Tax=Staphylococcus pasteuri TaxID=45972 RepID=UPI000D368181|nr:phage head-tail adapter protein [Staphylococcus pasteuri]MEB7433341.1 phage head-tail adapter protein [Staphylococcus pasteuri]PTU88127.1 phage head-tail adapter protein [Staphylococcus pasteuri]RFD69610.1 phage head-tail adapter protein [Staphylococcus pasteuri]
MKTPFKKPFITTKKLNTKVHFYEYQANKGPEAGVKRKKILYSCWAYVPQWKMTELQNAIANGTEHDVKIFIRETHGQYVPSERHYINVESSYITQDLNIKLVQPDVENEDFLMILGGVTTS